MTDHADTIRRLREFLSRPTIAPALRDEYLGLLDALLAERQQAIDALREIATNFDIPATSSIRQFARAALKSLGEQP